MKNLTIKMDYLRKAMKGFENIMGTLIYCVEQYTNEFTLDIYARVNPTNDMYLSRSEMVDAVIKYDLIKGTYTIKAEGKGSRKFGRQVKEHMTTVIDSLVQEAYNNYKYDCDESQWLTQKMYHAQLKEAGASNALLNEFYVESKACETTKEITELFIQKFDKMLDLLTPATTEPTQENEVAENNSIEIVDNQNCMSYDSECKENNNTKEVTKMEMIIHPKSYVMQKAENFQMFEDWKEVDFINAYDCEIIEVAGGFKLVGTIEGESFESFMNFDDYFDGKPFILPVNHFIKQYDNVIPFPRMVAPAPAQEKAQEKASVGVTTYTPEMGDKKPVAEIEAKLSLTGSKWRLKTPLELKGRGITLHDSDNGINIYYATERAFERLETQYSISLECLLD